MVTKRENMSAGSGFEAVNTKLKRNACAPMRVLPLPQPMPLCGPIPHLDFVLRKGIENGAEQPLSPAPDKGKAGL